MYAVPIYIVVMLVMITFDYWAALWISRTDGRGRKIALIASILGNGLLLFSFKYYNLFADSMNVVLDTLHISNHLPHSSWLLPIGLSFHNLQSIAYIVDVYRKSIKPERNYIIFGLFVMFYPQMVAGPIERAAKMLPQFRQKHELRLQNVVEGGQLILWGLFQKLVIADRLAIVVNKVYADPGSHSTTEILLALFFFFIQIYCDFCGYSDIARGCARVMGFELSLNFNNPFAARNLIDFWSRWHLSLTSWIRTYIFFPMMRSKIFGGWALFNVVAMFVFSGLWHGANWTFIVWGILNGLVYLIQRKNRFLHSSGFKYIKIAMNIGLISLLCVFFRSTNLEQSGEVFKYLFVNYEGSFNIMGILDRLAISPFDLLIDLLLALFIIGIQIAMDAKGKNYIELVKIPGLLPTWLRYLLIYALIFGILFLGVFTGNTFIYFQF